MSNRNRVINIQNSMLTGSTGYVNGIIAPIARLDLDGQNGITTDFRTLNANTPYVRRDVYCFVLETPAAWAYFGTANHVQMVKGFKALMETKTEKISGLDSSIKAEYTQMNVNANEVFDAFTRSTRERSEPSHTWTELYGRAIGTFMETWITMCMGDPVTGIPGVVTLKSYLKEHARNQVKGYNVYTLMPENISATCIYIEPDPSHTFAVNAWLCTNMMPDNAGERTGERDRTSAPDKQEITVKFTCMQEVNSGVMILANNILASMDLGGLNGNDRRAYIGDTYYDVIESDANSGGRQLSAHGGGKWDANDPIGTRTTGILSQTHEIQNTQNVRKMVAKFAAQNGGQVSETMIPSVAGG